MTGPDIEPVLLHHATPCNTPSSRMQMCGLKPHVTARSWSVAARKRVLRETGKPTSEKVNLSRASAGLFQAKSPRVQQTAGPPPRR